MPRKSRKAFLQEQPPASTSIEKLKCAAWGYTRISNNGDKSEDSIESQTAIIQDFVSDKSDFNLCGTFTDLGFSGTNFDRPGYTELLAGIVAGDVQCVVVKDLSRLGRTYIEVGELLFDTFPAHNIRFISVNDNYDSFADDAARKKLLILFKNLVNHMYSKDIGTKIKSVFALKQQNGEVFSSLPPYGYKLVREAGVKRLVVEPEATGIVKQIFDMREQGISAHMISNFLNRNKIPSPRAHFSNLGILTNPSRYRDSLWQGNSVGKLLRNDVYVGVQAQGKYESVGKSHVKKPKSEWYVRENAHPAIIGKEQFKNVQTLLDRTRKKYTTNCRKMDENIFAGVIFCSRCGRALARTYNPRGAKPIYYYSCNRCLPELRHELGLSTATRLPYAKLEPIVFTTLQKQMDACIEIEALIEDVTKSAAISDKCRKLQAELNKHQRECKKADEMLASSYTHHLAGLLDSKEFDIARIKFERDRQEAELCMARVQAELAGYDLKKQYRNLPLANFRSFEGFVKLDKTLVSALVYRIEVTPLTNEINIVLNFTDEFEKLNNLIKESGVLADDL